MDIYTEIYVIYLVKLTPLYVMDLFELKENHKRREKHHIFHQYTKIRLRNKQLFKPRVHVQQYS